MSQLQDLEVFRKPQKFITFKGPVLEVNEKVLSELQVLSCYLAVVTVIGSYRTGKSWILNQLAGCCVEDGFGVADGQTAMTSGIWILCRNHPEKKDCVLVFLDTEGLHDAFKQDSTNEDNRLFIVSFLLSDTLIYNVMDKLSDHDLEKIGFITKVCENLLESEAKKTFPEFVLLLRDVAKLKLDKKEVSPKYYLEKVLDSGDQSNADLSPKKCIKQLCSKRFCFTLTQPTDFESLEELGETDHPELKPKFVEDFHKCKEHIIKKGDIKRFMSGSPCTASAFCKFVQEIVVVVGKNEIPKIGNLQEQIARSENERVWKQTTEDFKRVLRDETKIDLYGSLQDLYSTMKANCLQHLQKQLVPLSESDLRETREKFENFAKDEFNSLSRKLCSSFLGDHLESYFDMVKGKVYKSPGAVSKFQADMKRVQDLYERKTNLGPMKATVWMEKGKEIKRMAKEVEIQDLQYELSVTTHENKQEREKIDKKLHELEEEKRRIAVKERELEEKRIRDERRLQQSLQHLEEQQKKLETENKKLMKHVEEVNKLSEMKLVDAAVAEDTNTANITRSAIEAVAAVGIAALSALSRD